MRVKNIKTAKESRKRSPERLQKENSRRLLPHLASGLKKSLTQESSQRIPQLGQSTRAES